MSTFQTFSSGLFIQKSIQAKLPLNLSAFRLIAFDMDSTLINIECVDEIADVVGKKKEVAAITEAAMRGEISDYKESLRQRVALLKGVHLQDLEKVWNERLQLNSGAKELIAACKAQGLRILLVSGGFTFFTDRLHQQLQLDYSLSNVLAIKNDRLTGELLDQPWGDICDGKQKRHTVENICQQMGIHPQQAIAMGDGANDLDMMSIAGLSVAYHAKPKVKEHADVAIDTGGLDRLLELFN